MANVAPAKLARPRRPLPTKKPVRKVSLASRFALLLIPILGYALFIVGDKSLQTLHLQDDATALRWEIEQEKQENLRLQQALNQTRSDQRIEESARQDLGLTRPGDRAIVLSGPTPRPTEVTRSTTERPQPTDPLPPWLRWLLRQFGR